MKMRLGRPITQREHKTVGYPDNRQEVKVHYSISEYKFGGYKSFCGRRAMSGAKDSGGRLELVNCKPCIDKLFKYGTKMETTPQIKKEIKVIEVKMRLSNGGKYFYGKGVGHLNRQQMYEVVRNGDILRFVGADEGQELLSILKGMEDRLGADINLLTRIIKNGGFREYVEKLEGVLLREGLSGTSGVTNGP
jgi:hypothetical protein